MARTESAFPENADAVTATLIEIYRHQSRSDLVELLEQASSHFEHLRHDNWDGGIDFYCLRLEIPVKLYAARQENLQAIEKELLGALGYLNSLYSNDIVDNVSITPSRHAQATPRVIGANAVRRLWAEHRFRLFLSHVSRVKTEIARVKEALRLRGIAAFVAHEDIEPSLEWQAEIELALQSMDALAMFVTPDCHSSSWTDQEVGWALGRGLLVLPIQLGSDPYGFAGKVQAIRGALTRPNKLADDLARAMLKNRLTSSALRTAMLHAISHAESERMALAIAGLLVRGELSDAEKEQLWRACENGPQYMATAKEMVYATIGRPGRSFLSDAVDEIPF